MAHNRTTTPLTEQFPSDGEDPRTWARCERLLPHAVASGDHAIDIATAQTAVLLARVGGYLVGRGEYRAATNALERALQLTQAAHGPDHPDTLTSRNNLAYAYQATGRLAEAIPLYENTLSARERILGPEHPNTLSSRNNLAYAYQATGRLDQAVALYEQTLTGAEQNLGVDHPLTNSVRANLESAREMAEPR